MAFCPMEVDLRSTHTTPFGATNKHVTLIQVETIYNLTVTPLTARSHLDNELVGRSEKPPESRHGRHRKLQFKKSVKARASKNVKFMNFMIIETGTYYKDCAF